MRTIKLVLEYDGALFFGFQRQHSHRTVQSELEAAAKKLFQKQLTIYPAGRTDSGVHAEGQAVHFKTDSKIPLSKIQAGFNFYLPKEIAVTEIREMPASFHARFSAKRKTYVYHVYNSRVRSPLFASRSFQVPYDLNVAEMRKAAGLLKGKRDFGVFEASGSRRKSTVRTLYRLNIQKKGKHLFFILESDGFLYRMVRGIVGTLLWVGMGKIRAGDMRLLLKQKRRKSLGSTVPPHGLCLKSVGY